MSEGHKARDQPHPSQPPCIQHYLFIHAHGPCDGDGGAGHRPKLPNVVEDDQLTHSTHGGEHQQVKQRVREPLHQGHGAGLHE